MTNRLILWYVETFRKSAPNYSPFRASELFTCFRFHTDANLTVLAGEPTCSVVSASCMQVAIFRSHE